MSSKRLKRISNEILELQKSVEILKENRIYFYVNEDDINIVYALLIGPEKTPYENGFYFFKINYSDNYPMTPPIVKYCTQGCLLNHNSKKLFHVRFNPNLYTCGKVCLSMINTWQGDGWVPTNTITNVLIAIQGLVLTEEPLRNEPGYENGGMDIIVEYNNLIEYANIKIAVLDMLNEIPSGFEYFKDIINDYFLRNIDYYVNYVLTKNDIFKNSVLNSAYQMKVLAEYDVLYNEINAIKEKLINNLALNLEKECLIKSP